MTDEFFDRLEDTHRELIGAADTDADAAVNAALRLALHTASATDVPAPAAHADWDLAAASLDMARRAVGHTDPTPRLPLPAPPVDNAKLRAAVIDMLAALADRLAATATTTTAMPQRRLAWAQAAHYVDDALRELR